MPNNPKPPIQLQAHLRPPITKRVPDEQNVPITQHHIGLKFGPLPFLDAQRLAHAAHYGIECDVTMDLAAFYDEPLRFTAMLQGPKQAAWEDVDGEMRPSYSLVLVVEDVELQLEELDSLAEAAFPKKAPRSTVTILPQQEQLSMDDATNAIGDALKVTANGHQVNTETGEIVEDEELEGATA